MKNIGFHLINQRVTAVRYGADEWNKTAMQIEFENGAVLYFWGMYEQMCRLEPPGSDRKENSRK